MSSPSPLAPPNSASSDSEKMVADRKRPLSLEELPFKARRIDDSSPGDYEFTQDQDRHNIEAILHTLRMQRLSEYKQPVYVALMAKPNL
ncbi:hypothetical protein BGZ97_007040, partial [Linnemannia gamsii]